MQTVIIETLVPFSWQLKLRLPPSLVQCDFLHRTSDRLHRPLRLDVDRLLKVNQHHSLCFMIPQGLNQLCERGRDVEGSRTRLHAQPIPAAQSTVYVKV